MRCLIAPSAGFLVAALAVLTCSDSESATTSTTSSSAASSTSGSGGTSGTVECVDKPQGKGGAAGEGGGGAAGAACPEGSAALPYLTANVECGVLTCIGESHGQCCYRIEPRSCATNMFPSFVPCP